MRLFKKLAILALILTRSPLSSCKAEPPASPTSDAKASATATATTSSVSTAPSQPSTATPGSTNAVPSDKGKPKAPAKARDYLEAGAKLHNKGRYELADRYLKEAERLKDRLTLNEQVVLRVYREKVDQQLERLSTPLVVEEAPRSARFSEDKIDKEVKATSVIPSSTLPESSVAGLDTDGMTTDDSRNPSESSTDSLDPRAEESKEDPFQKLFGSETLRNSDDTKQRGRWLLSMAREQIFRGNYDKAREIAAKVKEMNIPWGRFDDSPEKVTEALAKAEQIKSTGSNETTKSASLDRRTAKARLREARAAMLHGELDQAEAIVKEVNSWRVGFYFFDDTPAKVFSAIDSARRRKSTRAGETTTGRPSLDSSISAAPDPLSTDLESPSNYLKGTRFAPSAGPIELNDNPR